MDNVDKKIFELACTRNEMGGWAYGRRAIMNQVPGVTEWRVRRIIGEARGPGSAALTAPTPAEHAKLAKTKENMNVPRIIVNIPQRKLPVKPKKAVEQWVIGSDFHAPWHHKKSCELFYQIIEDIQPERVILLGDVINLDPFSRYDKIPGTPTWLDDVASAGQILGSVKQAAPEAQLDWFMGNHEERLKKHLIRNDPVLYKHMDMQKLFVLSDNADAVEALSAFNYIDRNEVFEEELNLILAHGYRVRKHSGMSAYSLMESTLTSVIVGHGHRLGIYRKATARSRYLSEQPLYGVENGCLCRFDIPYLEGKTSNWQRGFTVLAIDRSGDNPIVEPSIVEIGTDRALFRGNIYRL